MSINLNKATDRLSKSMDQVSKSIDQVFLDVNSVFVEVDKVFDEINEAFDADFGSSYETVVNGKKTTVTIDALGNVYVNGQKVVPEQNATPEPRKWEDIKQADPKENPLPEETASLWQRILKSVFGDLK